MSPSTTIFLFDTGTTGKDPWRHHVHTLAVQRHPPSSSSTPHLHLRIRPPGFTFSPFPQPPPFHLAWPLLETFIDDHTASGSVPLLVAHNLSFDLNILLAELSRDQLSVPAHWRFACSLDLAREIFDGGVSQSDLAEKYAVRVRRAHHAEDDVRTLSAILTHMKRDVDGGVQKALAERAMSESDFMNKEVKRMIKEPTGTGKWIVTRMGGKFHVDEGCKGLAKAAALFFTDHPAAKLTPCKVCLKNERREDLLGESSEASRSMIATEVRQNSDWNREVHVGRSWSGESSSASETGKYLTTRTGKLYHFDENCYGLRNAKRTIAVEQRPSDLSACKMCAAASVDEPIASEMVARETMEVGQLARMAKAAETKIARRAVAPVVKRDGGRSGVKQTRTTKESTLASFPEGFLTTTYGTKFHLNSCKHVRGKKVRECHPLGQDSGQNPCRVCLLPLFQAWDMAKLTT